MIRKKSWIGWIAESHPYHSLVEAVALDISTACNAGICGIRLQMEVGKSLSAVLQVSLRCQGNAEEVPVIVNLRFSHH